jgi:phage I-like protein
MEDTNKTPADAGAVATLALIAVTLGMASSSSEREVQANVRALADDARELQRATGKSTNAEALGTVKAWQVSHEALSGVQAELAALRLRDSDRELNALIESAKASGKITSDSLEATCRAIGSTSPAQLRSLIETLPVVGGGVTRSTATQEPERAVALTEEDHAVGQMLGISSEDMAATRRADRARKAG